MEPDRIDELLHTRSPPATKSVRFIAPILNVDISYGPAWLDTCISHDARLL